MDFIARESNLVDSFLVETSIVYLQVSKKTKMKKLTMVLSNSKKIVFICILSGISSFILNSCNNTSDNTQSTQSMDTTTMVAPDSAARMIDTSAVIDTSGGKDVNGGKDKKP